MLFKKKRKTIEEVMKDMLGSTEDVRVDMKVVEKLAKENPDRMIFQKVKNPEEFRARFHALHYSMTGDYDKAIEHADKGLKINPESAYLFYIRGCSKGDIGAFDGGIKDLSEAIRLKPNYADAFVERGHIKEKMGDVGVGGCWNDYDTALTIEPSVVLPHDYGRVRGVKLLYYVQPQLKKEDMQGLRSAIIQGGCFRFFKNGEVEFFPTEVDNIMEVKFFYPETRFLINPNDSQKFYEELFDKVFDLVKEFLNSRSYKLVGYSHEILSRLWPTEAEDLIPMPELKLKGKKLD